MCSCFTLHLAFAASNPQAPAASGEGISGSAAEQPPAYPQFHESELPPLVAGGGCPFKQGDVADLKPASVPSPQRSPLPPQQLPISATKPITPQDLPSAPSQPTPHSCSPLPPHVATLPSHTPTPPKQQLSSPSPSALIPPVQAATQVQMAAGPSTLSSLSASQPTSQTKAQMAAQSHAQPQVQTLSPAQLAAFQAAYAKALQEQKNLYQKMHPQKPAAGAAPLAGTCVSNSHSQGGMSTGAANAVASSHSLPSPSAGPPLNPPSQGGRGSGGKCRCEPHSKPTSASTSTAAASVFASGRPGGVTEQGESSGVGCVSSPQDDEALASHGVMACSDSDMGAPDATADEDEDGVDGKVFAQTVTRFGLTMLCLSFPLPTQAHVPFVLPSSSVLPLLHTKPIALCLLTSSPLCHAFAYLPRYLRRAVRMGHW